MSVQTAEDIAAARRILGLDVNPPIGSATALRSQRIRSSDGTQVYLVEGRAGAARMKPTTEDRAALARLLGLGDPDPKMYLAGELLPGVIHCVHPMTGNGLSIADPNTTLGAGQAGLVVADEWRQHPYYHHTFVPTQLTGGHSYCNCGNPEHHDLHRACGAAINEMLEGIEIEVATRAINHVNASFMGMPLDQWKSYGALPPLSQTCDDCGRSDGTHNPAVEH